MDTIRFNILPIENKGKIANSNDLRFFDVEVFLNEERLSNSLLNLANVLAVCNVNKLSRGIPFEAHFDLFTCECGVPGCAGFHDSIQQSVNDFEVVWVFPVENYYKTSKFVYSFDKMHFMQEVQRFAKKVFDLEEEMVYHQTQVRDDERFFSDSETTTENTSETVISNLEDDVSYYIKNFSSYQKFNLLMKRDFPEMADKKFKWFYKGEIINYDLDYSFDEVVCKILNNFPSQYNDNSFYFGKAKLAGIAVKDLLIGNNQKFIKMINNIWNKRGLTPYDFVYVGNLSDINEDNFDINLLTLHQI